MSIVNRVMSGFSARSATLSQPPTWLTEALGGGSTTYSGKKVTGQAALELVPVMSASSLVASAVGGVPLKVYRSSDRSEARNTRQWRMLHDSPNEEQAADEVWEWAVHCLITWGNAFFAMERDGFDVVQQLWPIAPSRMEVGREPVGNNRARRYFKVDGGDRRYYEDSILHIRGLGADGLIGYSVIQMARQQLGNMLAQDEFSGRFWGNGTFMGAALLHPGQMSDPAQKRLKKQIREKTGLREVNGIWVFEEDMKYQQLGMPLRDAQWFEQAKLSRLAVAEMFGLVPPHRWGGESGQMTYANTEVAGTEFVRWTGRRWWKRIEGSMSRTPAIFPFRSELYPEFVTSDLMRGDTKTRFETYQIGIAGRFLTVNEARAAENLPPVEGGDVIPDPTPPPAAAPPADQTPPQRSLLSVPHIDVHLEQDMSPVADEIGRLGQVLVAGNEQRSEDDRRTIESLVEVAITAHTGSVEAIRSLADQPPPTVVVNVPPAEVTVNVPTQPAPVVHVQPAPSRREVTFHRDRTGSITDAVIDEA
jgi:HK97 family phage portal protein